MLLKEVGAFMTNTRVGRQSSTKLAQREPWSYPSFVCVEMVNIGFFQRLFICVLISWHYYPATMQIVAENREILLAFEGPLRHQRNAVMEMAPIGQCFYRHLVRAVIAITNATQCSSNGNGH
jgi:hypothetical protein